MNVLEAVQKSASYLELKGIESARTNAELLLADILGCKRLDLYLQFQKPLNKIEIDKYREYIKRRGEYEPLQYIVGSVEFFGFEFKVSEKVLIPRQETEILIETILENLNPEEEFSVLDIGTGSGNIPVCIGKLFEKSSIVSIDISEEALKQAQQNVEMHELSERIKLFKRDIFVDAKNGASKFDVIVSNPPYVSISEYNSLQPEIIEFEPKNAVTDDNDGYLFYNRICKMGNSLLKNGSKIFFEIGKGQSEGVQKILEINGFKNIQVKKDYLDIDRVVFAEF